MPGARNLLLGMQATKQLLTANERRHQQSGSDAFLFDHGSRARHAHAIEIAHEGIPPPIIPRQLGMPILISLQESIRTRSSTRSVSADRR
jgi:hypothetical protein